MTDDAVPRRAPSAGGRAHPSFLWFRVAEGFPLSSSRRAAPAAVLRLTLLLAPTALPLFAAVPAAAQSVLAPIWSGIYLGAHAGGNLSDFESSVTSRNFELDGYALGVHGGVNMQVMGIVLGVEADATLTDAAHTSGVVPMLSASSAVDWIGSVRARLGYALGPLHVYATAGMAWTETTVVGHRLGAPFGNSTELQSGIVYGAGVEAQLIPNVSFRFEALRYDFDTELHTLTGDIGGNTVNEILAVEPDFTVFRAGVSLHLN